MTGFLDRLREKLQPREWRDDYYEDEYYDESYDEETEDSSFFGTARRPEVESVSVYTRSGRPLDDSATTSERGSGVMYASNSTSPSPVSSGAPHRVVAGRLPPYVLKPTAYDDVQTIAQRIRTNQPVILSFKNTNIDCAKRILDFSFGLACGVGGTVSELGDRAFAVLPYGMSLSDADISKLVAAGIISR